MKPLNVLFLETNAYPFVNSPEMAMSVQFFSGSADAIARQNKRLRMDAILLSTHYILPIANQQFLHEYRVQYGHDFFDTNTDTAALCCVRGDPQSPYGWSLLWDDDAARLGCELVPTRAPGPVQDQWIGFLAALANAFAAPPPTAPAAPPAAPPAAAITRPLRKFTGEEEGFLRFTFQTPDRRVNSATGEVTPDTFCAPFRDGQKIVSGFEAVGRFALPVPLPYRYVVLLVPPAGTPVEIGTVTPNFGQAGGGVEAMFPAGFKNQNLHYHALPSY